MGLVEDALVHVSPQSAGLALGVGTVLYFTYKKIDEVSRLSKLGPRGQRVISKLPFGMASPSQTDRLTQRILTILAGIDVLKGQVDATIQHKNYEGFLHLLEGLNGYTAETRLLGKRIVFTADPENIKAILAKQFDDYGKGEPFHREWSEFLGDSIFTTDGHAWHTSRQLIRPLFVKERVSDLHVFESHLETLFKAIANGGALNGPNQEVDLEAGNGKPVDLSDLFFRYTLDVATDYLLGKDVQSLT